MSFRNGLASLLQHANTQGPKVLGATASDTSFDPHHPRPATPPFPNWTAIDVNWFAGFDFEIKVITRIPDQA